MLYSVDVYSAKVISMDGFDFSVDCDITASHLSVTDRYFKKKYKIDITGTQGEDLCVLLHSNKICIITLAPSHPILAENKTVSTVDFQVEKEMNRLDNKVSGKGKRGAQSLSRTSPLCHVTCSDGSKFTISSCIKGSLIEANANLVKNPGLLTSKPDSDGYVAIVLVNLKDYDRETGAKLKTVEEYQEIIKERQKQTIDKVDVKADAEANPITADKT